MDREKAKALLPIIQAFAEGKSIEFKDSYGKWIKSELLAFDLPLKDYRIKTEPKYHPFKDAEECWQEMQKHQPFGWIKDKYNEIYLMITRVNDNGKTGSMSINGYPEWDFLGLIDNYTFADGTPFGIKEE